MIAVDSNILVYAHRADLEWHAAAAGVIRSLAEGRASWAIAWPCVHEFLAIVTNARIFGVATSIDAAIDQVAVWIASPSLLLLTEGTDHWAVLSKLLRSAKVRGGAVHDARIAAICLDHGVRELWTADRDFSRFAAIKTRNPLVTKN